jgi:hypothetical protein
LTFFLFSGLQDAVDAAEDGERQDDILVLATLEGIPDQVRNAPDETDLLPEVVHAMPPRSGCLLQHIYDLDRKANHSNHVYARGQIRISLSEDHCDQ